MTNDYDFFVQELRDYLSNHVKYFQLDKRWMKTEFGSMTKALEFFHVVFERLSLQSGMHFSIYTDQGDARRYFVSFHKSKPGGVPAGVRYHPAFEIVARQKFGELSLNKEELERVYVFQERFEAHLKRISEDQGVVFVIEDVHDALDLVITWTPKAGLVS